MSNLSFITLLSYDWPLALKAIESYADVADEIILGLDKQRITWSGSPFSINMDEIRTFLLYQGIEYKTRIVEENFHSHSSPMTNDIEERKFLSKLCAPGNWIVQIDADEILYEGKKQLRELLDHTPDTHELTARWLCVFKKFGDEALVVSPAEEVLTLAGKVRGEYVTCRSSGRPQIASPVEILHYSFARSSGDLHQKLINWGHSRDFDTAAYFKFWESVTLDNYSQCRDFHPLCPALWHSLVKVRLP